MKQLKWIITVAIGMTGCAGNSDSQTAQHDPGMETVHAFGIVDIVGATALRQHRFQFTNTTDVPMRVTHVASSCGCTKSEVTREAIAPGATVPVDVEMQFASSGRKDVDVTLATNSEELPLITYALTGIGRLRTSISFERSAMTLGAGDSAEVTIMYSSLDAEAVPEKVTVSQDTDLQCEIARWRLVQRPSVDRTLPGRWIGTIEIHVAAFASPGTRRIVTRSPSGQEANLNVRITPPDRARALDASRPTVQTNSGPHT